MHLHPIIRIQFHIDLYRWKAAPNAEYFHQLAQIDHVRFVRETEKRSRLINDMKQKDAQRHALERQQAERMQIMRLEHLHQKQLAADKRAKHAPKRAQSKKQMSVMGPVVGVHVIYCAIFKHRSTL